MVAEDELQSQPCESILHTNAERLEGLSLCKLPESVQRHTMGMQKVSMGQAKFVPTHYDSKIGCGDHFIDQIPISTLFNHSLHSQ